VQEEKSPFGEWLEPQQCSGVTLQAYLRSRLLSEGKVCHLIQALSVLTNAPVKLISVGADHAVLSVQDSKGAMLAETIAEGSKFHQQHGYYAVIQPAAE